MGGSPASTTPSAPPQQPSIKAGNRLRTDTSLSGASSEYQNKLQQKNFVQRFNQPEKNIKNPDGSVSTHKMATAEIDGMNIAFPTIVEKNGKLVELPINEAIDFALQNNEFAEFATPQDAQSWAEGGYKNGTQIGQTTPTTQSLKTPILEDSEKLNPFNNAKPEVRKQKRDYLTESMKVDVTEKPVSTQTQAPIDPVQQEQIVERGKVEEKAKNLVYQEATSNKRVDLLDDNVDAKTYSEAAIEDYFEVEKSLKMPNQEDVKFGFTFNQMSVDGFEEYNAIKAKEEKYRYLKSIDPKKWDTGEQKFMQELSMEAISTKVDADAAKLDILEENTDFDGFNKAMVDLTPERDAIDKEIAALSNGTPEDQKVAQQVKGTVSAFNKKVKLYEQQAGELDKLKADIDAKTKLFEETGSTDEKLFGELNASVDKYNQTLEAINTAADLLDKEQEDINATIGGLDAKQNAKKAQLDAKIAAFNAKIEEAKKSTGVSDAKIEEYGKLAGNLGALSKAYEREQYSTDYSGIIREQLDTERQKKEREARLQFTSDLPITAGGALTQKIGIYLDEFGRGVSGGVGDMVVSIPQALHVLEQFATGGMDTDYDWIDKMYDSGENMKRAAEGGTGAPVTGNRKMSDMPIAAQIAYTGGNAIGSMATFMAGGALGGASKIGQLSAVFTTAFLGTEAMFYQEAIDAGMNPADAATSATILAAGTAGAEMLVNDAALLGARSFSNQFFKQVAGGVSAKEATKQFIKALGERVAFVGKRAGTEWFEEVPVQQVVEDVSKEQLNNYYGKEYFKNTFDPDVYQQASIGSIFAGGGMAIVSSTQSQHPNTERLMLEAARMSSDQIAAMYQNQQPIQQTLPDGTEITTGRPADYTVEITRLQENLAELESRPAFEELDEQKQAHLLALKNQKHNLEQGDTKDPLISAQIERIDNEVNEILSLGENGIDPKQVGTTTAPKDVMVGDRAAKFFINEDGDYELQFKDTGMSTVIAKGPEGLKKISEMGIKDDAGKTIAEGQQNYVVDNNIRQGAKVMYRGKEASVNKVAFKDGKVVYVNLQTDKGGVQVRAGQSVAQDELLKDINERYSEEGQQTKERVKPETKPADSLQPTTESKPKTEPVVAEDGSYTDEDGNTQYIPPLLPETSSQDPKTPTLEVKLPELSVAGPEGFAPSLRKLGYTDDEISKMTIEQQQEIVINKTSPARAESSAKVDSVKENARQEKIAAAQAQLDDETTTGTEAPVATKTGETVAPINLPPTVVEQGEDKRIRAKQIAEDYIDAQEKNKFTAEQQAIVDVGLSIKRDSFEEFGDKNNITSGLAKAYFSEGGLTVDQIATAASNELGKEVTTDDVIDLIMQYPNGLSERSSRAKELAKEYYELTGKNLTLNTARAALNNTKKTPKQERSNDKILTDSIDALSREGLTTEDGQIDAVKLKEIIEDKEFFTVFPLGLSENEYQNLKEYVQQSENNAGESTIPIEPEQNVVEPAKPKGKNSAKAQAYRDKAKALRDGTGGTVIASVKLYAKALEVYADLLDTFDTVTEAIKEFRKTKEYQALEQGDRDEIENEIAEPPTELSGIKKALAPEEVVANTEVNRRSAEEMLDMGKKLVENGSIDPVAIINDIVEKPRALQPDEVAALVYYKAKLDKDISSTYNEIQKAMDSGDPDAELSARARANKLEIDLLSYQAMSVVTAYEQSLAFRLRKMLLDDQYNLADQITQYKANNGGTIPADVEARMREADKKIKEANAKIDELEKQQAELEKKLATQNIKEYNERQKKKSSTQKAKESADKFRERFKTKPLVIRDAAGNEITITTQGFTWNDVIEIAAKAIEKSGKIADGIKAAVDYLNGQDWYKNLSQEDKDAINTQLEEQFDEMLEGLKIPTSVVREFVENGVTDAEQLVKEVQKLYPEYSEREVMDAISGYGRKINPSIDEVRTELSRMKGVMRKLAMLEDLRNKIPKQKNPRAKAEMSKREKDLLKQIKEEFPEFGKMTEQERQDAAKVRAEEKIKEYEDRISRKDFSTKPKRKPVDMDSELIRLEAQKEKAKTVFEKEKEKLLLSQRKLGQTLWQGFKDLLNAPKAIRASLDLSAPFRQGAIFIFTQNPLKTARDIYDMYKMAGVPLPQTGNKWYDVRKYKSDKEYYEDWQNALKVSPYYPLAKRSGLYIADEDGKLTAREEVFMSGIVKNKVPFFGKGGLKERPKSTDSWAKKIWGLNLFGGSEQGYAGFLNKMRYDNFVAGAEQLISMGLDPIADAEEFKSWASFVNNATARGSLGKFEQAAETLNTFFFSPKMIAARFNLLMNPLYYYRLKPNARKMAMKRMSGFFGVMSMIIGMAAMYLNNDDDDETEVELDPRSSDFAKIKIGNTRIDVLAGFQQYIRASTQFATGERKSTKSGALSDADRFEVLVGFFANKLAPVPAIGYERARSKVDKYGVRTNMMGEVFDWKENLGELAIPLYLGDLSEIAQENSPVTAAFLATLSFHGGGVSSFGGEIDLTRKYAKKGAAMFEARTRREPNEEEYKLIVERANRQALQEIRENKRDRLKNDK